MKPTKFIDRILWPVVRRKTLYAIALLIAVAVGFASSVMAALGMVSFGWMAVTIFAAFSAEAIQHSRWRYLDAVNAKRRDIVEKVLGSDAVATIWRGR